MFIHHFLWGMAHKQASAWCAAARSTTIRTTPVAPSAKGTIQIPGTTISVFGSVCAHEKSFYSLFSARQLCWRL